MASQHNTHDIKAQNQHALCIIDITTILSSEECIRDNRRGRLTKAYVVGIWSGDKENNPFGFEQKIHSV
jgi:hypothetical protein